MKHYFENQHNLVQQYLVTHRKIQKYWEYSEFEKILQNKVFSENFLKNCHFFLICPGGTSFWNNHFLEKRFLDSLTLPFSLNSFNIFMYYFKDFISFHGLNLEKNLSLFSLQLRHFPQPNWNWLGNVCGNFSHQWLFWQLIRCFLLNFITTGFF